MPLPHWLAPFNRQVANRLTGRLAARLPGFGVVVHTGRKTHREYCTPVALFQRAGDYVIALAYGRDTDWVRNVLAYGGCRLETRGRQLRLSQARLFHDERRRFLPAPVRLIFGLAGISDFVALTPEVGR